MKIKKKTIAIKERKERNGELTESTKERIIKVKTTKEEKEINTRNEK